MKKVIYIALISLFFVGCGGGGSSSTKTTSEERMTQKGYFIDSKVEGLRYDCEGVAGYTDSEGAFYFSEGSSCKFYANKVLIKEAKDIFDGIYIVEKDKDVVKFLLTLDKDGDFNNGIQIPKDAEAYIPEELPSGDEIDNLQSKLQKNIGTYNGYAPTDEEVLEHIEATLEEHRPVAIGKKYEVLWNNPLNIVLEAKDNQTSKFKFEITRYPKYGKLVGKVPNIQYVPNSDFTGTDSFSFIANDYSLDSKEANITLEVTKNPSTVFVNKKGMVVDLGNVGVDKKIYLQDSNLSLYLVFTNYSEETATVDVLPKNNESDKNLRVINEDIKAEENIVENSFKKDIEQFNNSINLSELENIENEDSVSLLSEKVLAESSNETFYLTKDTSASTEATLMLSRTVETEFGTKTLKVWVSTNSIEGDSCRKSNCVDMDSINNLADKFLKDGEANDIYDLVTNIYGEEWGADANDVYAGLINDNEEINILLTSLNEVETQDADQNGVVGFFYAKDNFKKSIYEGSNERMMIYIDVDLYATNDPYWENEIYLTLAHELQHMINFYQTNVVYSYGSETWLNEMLSEAIEDVVSVNLGLVGPRQVEASDPTAGEEGIVNGRFPYFNRYGISLTLNNWRYNIYDYSKVNAFGAFLTRKYGVKVLHEIMHNSYRGYEAIEYGVSSVLGYSVTIDEIFQEWASAIILSDDYSLENSVYNINDYIVSEVNSIKYKLGSINLFNYSPKPTIETTVSTVNAMSNYYYKINSSSKLIDLKVSSNQSDLKVLLIAK